MRLPTKLQQRSAKWALLILSFVMTVLHQLNTIEIVTDNESSRSISNNHMSRHDEDSINTETNLPSNDNAASQALPYPSQEQRSKCQIIYILGVEGTMHHGIEPILETLAHQQTDHTNTHYHVSSSNDNLRFGLFAYPAGQFGYLQLMDPPPINDPTLVHKVISSICPNDGHHHVIIESTSFPSGGKHHSTSRISRQNAWHSMTPEGIANSYAALNHPTNLYMFYDAYSPYVEVKFVVLNRGFLDTVASHARFDDGPLRHANVIMGYLILLSRFLESHRYDKKERGGEKLWTVLHVDDISAKNYKDESELINAREGMVRHLAKFLKWPNEECGECFQNWIDSTRDGMGELGAPKAYKLTQQIKALEGIWPPLE